ncbi:MAG: sodium:solute symporter family protein [Tepidanaerobacteraceae bacterium]|nr:sodium:solute symporter family protein [Tepidanaerobacteraceae bacterium]
MDLTAAHIAGIAATLAAITAVGVYSGKNIKSNADFSVGGRKAGSLVVAGTIIGTLVGGASTIGTAQLAFAYGFSAWWFNLGAGIGCLILGLLFAKPLYNTDKHTVPQMLAEEFGPAAGPVSSFFSSLGIFLSVVAQVLSAVALLTAMFNMPPLAAAAFSIILMAAYVVFGGVWGTGLVGIAKLLLIYISMLVGGVIAFSGGGGLAGYKAAFPAFPYFSLFGRGFWVDFAAGFSLVIGVLSTQTYIQAVISGKSLKEARAGALISAAVIPPIGVAGTFIGLYMKIHFPDINPALAFPYFVLKTLNPWFGGIVLATLLVATVGGGAGLALGISTILTNDIYARYIKKDADDLSKLKFTRFMIVFVLALTLIFIAGNIKSMILNWNFMSMGLRGAGIFIPLCAALFFKGRVNKNFAILSMIMGPLSMLAGKNLLPKNVDPLFLGIAVNFIIILMGLAWETMRWGKLAEKLNAADSGGKS